MDILTVFLEGCLTFFIVVFPKYSSLMRDIKKEFATIGVVITVLGIINVFWIMPINNPSMVSTFASEMLTENILTIMTNSIAGIIGYTIADNFNI